MLDAIRKTAKVITFASTVEEILSVEEEIKESVDKMDYRLRLLDAKMELGYSLLFAYAALKLYEADFLLFAIVFASLSLLGAPSLMFLLRNIPQVERLKALLGREA